MNLFLDANGRFVQRMLAGNKLLRLNFSPLRRAASLDLHLTFALNRVFVYKSGAHHAQITDATSAQG